MFKYLSVFVIIGFIFFIQCSKNEDNDVFVPTKEWQTVRKGQKIPKGLHVRINLETGETEAKLLDEAPEDKTRALSALPPENPKSTLGEAVTDTYTPDELKKIKNEFRSYDEIKKTLGDLKLTPKMDAEIIADLLQRHQEVVDKTELLKILEDLDFLAHQYDNAREFVKQNGFREMIYKNLNSTDSEVKKETLKLMTALMQNNVNPKIHALESGAVGVLLRLVNFESDLGVKTRALSALGALLRSFPAAQRKFVESGGLSVLSKFFDSDDIKLQIKLVTMISDLLVEHEYSVVDENLSKYYVKFDLTKRILEHDWCKKLNKLLLGLLITDKDDHDSVEKCLTAMHSLRAHCGDKYEKDLITNLRKRYDSLLKSDGVEDQTFYKGLKDLCDEILYHVNNSVKTEL
ncbi:Nucleotide exchange factor SIL1-like Protein [Tribolium castaneum]|uniref:Nucleotide exchange factor SIL1 n=1 Tax=Tribolium castaneum TaxID=7070 RepID=D6X0N1_TRICA|nr:PREDICTED: nucleotide exchange factor SIL1 [Tribolium castaneum]EFA10120.2 Nucleotide exchange factor SIL1-like Protein [Tribolium castaneum]|eukprot:XP_008197571.1 PREDICTED: nucleotide exchange factor SIL1 [Tribolium castaneum]